MKDAIIHRVRTVAPGAIDAGLRVRGLLPVSYRRAKSLRAELDGLRRQIRELKDEIDELRGDALRVAELTDIVEQRLAGTER